MFHLIAAAILASATHPAPCPAHVEPSTLTSAFSVEDVLATAEASFAAVRNELGLTGAAPLYGTHAEPSKPARNAREGDGPRRRLASRTQRLSVAPSSNR